MGGTGYASGLVSSPASEVFGLLTDIDRFSEWTVTRRTHSGAGRSNRPPTASHASP